MDEARTVIRRLERIETLQSEQAPAAALLTEVRQLLREGEAWLAAERDEAWSRPALEDEGRAVGGAACDREATAGAAAALAGCRERLGGPGEVTVQTTESASL